MSLAKYKMKDIAQIERWTHRDLVGKQITEAINCNDRLEVGFYQSSNANWSYKVYVVKYNGVMCEVVTRFGEILGRD